MTALPSKHFIESKWPHRNTTAKEHMEERSGEGDVDSRIQDPQLDMDGSTEQSWTEKSGLWCMFHRKRQR